MTSPFKPDSTGLPSHFTNGGLSGRDQPHPGTAGGAFVGREREMGQLRAALNDAFVGRGRLVMLAGEPGIGKTRVAQELASCARTLGAQVLWGWCYEQEGAPPYWPWAQPIRDYVQRCDPEQLTQKWAPARPTLSRNCGRSYSAWRHHRPWRHLKNAVPSLRSDGHVFIGVVF